MALVEKAQGWVPAGEVPSSEDLKSTELALAKIKKIWWQRKVNRSSREEISYIPSPKHEKDFTYHR
jgi:hypothetical protein